MHIWLGEKNNNVLANESKKKKCYGREAVTQCQCFRNKSRMSGLIGEIDGI